MATTTKSTAILPLETVLSRRSEENNYNVKKRTILFFVIMSMMVSTIVFFVILQYLYLFRVESFMFKNPEEKKIVIHHQHHLFYHGEQDMINLGRKDIQRKLDEDIFKHQKHLGTFAHDTFPVLSISHQMSPQKKDETDYQLVHKPIENSNIKRISLLGERNSGTRWIYRELKRCFKPLKVERHFKRYKHWFQDEDDSENPLDTLVIAQFRDPYYWVDAMKRKPHHASAHLFLNWKDFVTKPWTMPSRVGLDRTIQNYTDVMCQENFRFHEVNSCHPKPYPTGSISWSLHWSEDKPLYELRRDKSGLPYDSILELRSDKIKNFVMEVPTFHSVKGFILTRYEDLLHNGTASLLSAIEERTGIVADCEPTPSQPNRKIEKLDPEFLQYLSDHIDWEAEALIGYEKRSI